MTGAKLSSFCGAGADGEIALTLSAGCSFRRWDTDKNGRKARAATWIMLGDRD
jgi:hypothetical protein